MMLQIVVLALSVLFVMAPAWLAHRIDLDARDSE